MKQQLTHDDTTTLNAARLNEEFQYALGRIQSQDLKSWGSNSALRFGRVFVKRLSNLAILVHRAIAGLAEETLQAFEALIEKRFGEHVSRKSNSIKLLYQRLSDSAISVAEGYSKLLRSDPTQAANQIFSTVIGFYAGSGGDGDGGIPDLDLIAGIGAHRSILTHSIIAGAFIETIVLAFLDLTKLIHKDLPESHSKFWDEMLEAQSTASESFVTGASIGIATHLGVDSILDGFTPYKDLPISLPTGAHEALLGLNALAEGAYGAKLAIKQWWLQNDGEKEEDSYKDDSGGEQSENTLMPDSDSKQDSAASIYNADFSGLSAHQVLEKSMDTCANAFIALHLNPTKLDEKRAECFATIERAGAPFRLGVIGEFRAGKSTLINAFLGSEVAFVDIIEATPVECVFRWGPELNATFHYSTGEEENMSVSSANERFGERRDDEGWKSSIDHVEYQVPCTRLENFNLWDSPGMGGSQMNQQVADVFLDKLGAAIWVFDATLLGKATIAEPLRRLKAQGTPVHAVINRIDEFSDSVEGAIELLSKVYPDTFETITTISALTAFEEVSLGQKSADLEEIWSGVCKSVGVTQAEGREARIERAVISVSSDFGLFTTKIRRETQEKVGLVDHITQNLEQFKTSLMASLESTLELETENAFRKIEIELSDHIRRLNDSEEAIQEIMKCFHDERFQKKLTEEIFRRSALTLNELWSRYSGYAIDLSNASIPVTTESKSLVNVNLEEYHDDVTVTPSASRQSKIVSQVRRLLQGSNIDDKAIEEGAFAAGISFLVSGALAATSAVTWPAILVALPIGTLVMWKKSLESQEVSRTPLEVFRRTMSDMQQKFVSSFLPKIATELENQLDESIAGILQAHCEELVGEVDLMQAKSALSDLQIIETALTGYQAESKNEFSGSEMLDLIKNPGSRVDMYIPKLNFSLSSILQVLPPETKVRLVITNTGQNFAALSENVRDAFGTWQGSFKVVCIQLADASALPLTDSLLLATDFAFTSKSSLSGILEGGFMLSSYSDGRLAAQKVFGELWEGKSNKYGELMRRPIY